LPAEMTLPRVDLTYEKGMETGMRVEGVRKQVGNEVEPPGRGLPLSLSRVCKKSLLSARATIHASRDGCLGHLACLVPCKRHRLRACLASAARAVNWAFRFFLSRSPALPSAAGCRPWTWTPPCPPRPPPGSQRERPSCTVQLCVCEGGCEQGVRGARRGGACRAAAPSLASDFFLVLPQPARSSRRPLAGAHAWQGGRTGRRRREWSGGRA
jgi:hypothetical protein